MRYVVLFSVLLLVAGCAQRQGSSLREGASYRNGTGSRAAFRLPDGSKVVLMPDTRIVVRSGFGKGNRGVELDGEALFDVVAGPFDVNTRDLRINVSAASRFHVDAWRSRPGEEVDLLAGRIGVRKSYHSDSDSLPETLEAGEMVMINHDIDLMEKEKLSPAELEKFK